MRYTRIRTAWIYSSQKKLDLDPVKAIWRMLYWMVGAGTGRFVLAKGIFEPLFGEAEMAFLTFPSLTRISESDECGSRRSRMDESTTHTLLAAIDRMAIGEKAALGEVYDLYGKIVYSVAFKILNSAADAEEATQDAFVALWKNAADLKGNAGRVLPWLLRTVRNRSIDRHRKEARCLPSSEQIARGEDRRVDEAKSEEKTALEAVLQKEQAGRVRQSMERLPSEQRRVIELAYFKGLSQSEIAESLGESLGTIKSRARYALARLRKELEGCDVA